MDLVYDNLRLHITNDAFYIESLQVGSSDVLVIDRISHEIELRTNHENIPPALAVSKPIYGLFGIINLVAGPYLVVIRDRERVGDIQGHTIWKVTETEVIPYKKSLLNLNEEQTLDNAKYLAMLESSLSTKSFYFSTSFDLTHSMQRLASAHNDFHKEPLSVRADPRFFWNHHALHDLIDRPELEKFAMPIMQGFISISSCFVKGRTFDVALISRRSILRPGTRYFIRGLDDNGNVANYVETEQILMYARQICSIIQTRGSIPLFWSQRPDLRYKPPIVLSNDHSETMAAFNKHFDSQVVLYGKQMVLNLVNHKGVELVLAKAFLEAVNESKNHNIMYEGFDFHHECGNNKWHRLSILMDKIDLEQEEFGYFVQDKEGVVFMQQTGIFRTNCMDCLDRTNVVQSLIARKSLTKQLKQMGIFEANSTIEEEKSLDYMLKQIWADNADFCSVQYAGTGALKTDFTRTGRRTKFGMLKDGYNSMVRYYKNNFSDGFRQDSIDLLVGNFVIMEAAKPPIFATSTHKKPVMMIFACYLAFSVLAFFTNLLSATGFGKQIFYVACWATATMLLFMVLAFRSGGAAAMFVNEPALVHRKKTD